ncbi:hypothetical protein F4556_005207 [Kitasatospora gansuensis]|uniref:Uncharacterized protein n=1 Tax=Kitasatospora gansuensis TaxID=258050 RepID=A0A7W7SGI1_9ACTN|nr:hypothetical protein [Kitasatospora gansuensis]MBB4949672.1 hypothetical protein [Kitasatospora gansuensis]
MPTTPLLFVTLDGVNWPLVSCRWVRYLPNGCATGSSYGTSATDAAAAAAHFTPAARDRAREHRRGVIYRLVSPDEWTATVRACLLGECTHQAAA